MGMRVEAHDLDPGHLFLDVLPHDIVHTRQVRLF